MSYQVINPLIQFVDPANGKPLSAGSVYFGRMDSDPKNQPSNRINVYAVQDDGSEVLLSQPIELNSAGQPQYSGSVKQIKVELYEGEPAYSVQAFSRTGVQKLYTPRVYSMLDMQTGVTKESLAMPSSDVQVAGVAAKLVANSSEAIVPLSRFVNFGGYSGVGAAINAAIEYCSASNKELLIDGQFTYQDPIVLKTFTKITGYGTDVSKLIYTGSASQWAMTTEISGGGNVAQRIQLSKFSLQGQTGTYDKKLFDANGVRYSHIEDVAFLNATQCMQLNLVWGNNFTSCSFKCGGDSGAIPAGSIGIKMVGGGAVNAISFRSCVVSFNDVAVDAVGAGRNVSFTDACTFESNATVFKFTGVGSSKGFLVEGNYFEANTTHHFYVDSGFGNRDDQITIKENYFDVTPNIFAGVITLGAAGVGNSSIAVIDNHIEQLVDGSNPVNPYVIYCTTASTNYLITYESRHNIRVIGAGAVKIGHINWANVDFRTFSSNVPYKPTYKTNPTTSAVFAPTAPTDAFKIYVSNGVARMVGNAVDAGNAYAGLLDVVDIPFSLSAADAEYVVSATQRSGSSAAMALGLVKGTAISLNFAAVPAGAVYVDVSWPLQLGDYL